jgi:uncharacterized membrane protein YvbJ
MAQQQYCPNCGNQVFDSENFCGACGFALKETEIVVETKKIIKKRSIASVVWNIIISLIAVGLLLLLLSIMQMAS